MNTLTKIASVAGLALVCSAASAEPYIGVAGGMGYTNATTKISEQTGYSAVGTKDDSKAAVSIYAGYAFTRTLAFEVGYTDFGKYNVNGWQVNSFGVNPVADSIHAQVVSATVVGSLPLSPVFGLEGKIGLGVMNQKYHCVTSCLDGNNLPIGDSTNNSTVGVIGVGAHWNLNRNLTLRTRFDYYGGATSPINGHSGVDDSMDYSMLSVGMDWHF